MQNPKLKHRKSLAVALCRLIAAARSQKDVLLLSTADTCANTAIQEYNDSHSELECNTEYRRFVDGLAQQFHLESKRPTVFAPSFPSWKQLETADRLISLILDKEKHRDNRRTNPDSEASDPRKKPKKSRGGKTIP